MIEAVHLSKEFARPVKEEGTEKKSGFSFGKKTMESFYAVDDLSFRAKKGEILGILGPNGAGKTTLLRMLGHLMTPTKGEVIVSDEEGNPITDEVKIKQAIGYLSNNTALYGRLTAREMFMLFGEIYGISKEDSAKRANEIFHLLEMEEFCDKRIEKLSTGQRQRASISRCLIHNPEIYIFDEPTLGLDILASETIIEFMKKEKERGKTVLYSTHYMEEAQYLCDRILMVYEGKKLAFGTPKQLMEITESDNLRDTFKSLIRELGSRDGTEVSL
ncbi:MAG: ABC transporter ATP-binding protein [Lachnospiraceae bacterium]|nr:ABC transporter ATP-binding protein [Lachnospiraceae bacterium]